MSMDYLRGLSPFNQLPARMHSGQTTHTHLLIMWPRIEPLSLIIHDVPQKVDAVLPVTHKWGTFPPPCDKVSLRKVRRDVISWCCSVCTWDKRLLLAFAPYVFANSLTVNWKDWGLKAPTPGWEGLTWQGIFFRCFRRLGISINMLISGFLWCFGEVVIKMFSQRNRKLEVKKRKSCKKENDGWLFKAWNNLEKVY